MTRILCVLVLWLTLWPFSGLAQAQQALTLRTLSGQRAAFSTWLLPDHSTVVVKLAQAQYDAWNKVGDAPGRPSVDARFLTAMGGIALLTGGDGWPVAGDAWEQVIGGRTRLIVATSNEPGWGYVLHDVEEPSGGFSRVTGFKIDAANRRVVLDAYDVGNLPTLHIASGATRRITRSQIVVPTESIATTYEALDFTVPNHRSVTYGSSATSYDNFTYPTAFSYAGPSISGSDTHLIVAFGIEYASNPSAVTHNGGACDQRVAQGTAGALRVYMYDRNSPSTSGTVAVTTPDGTAYVSTTSYATGVDSGNPRVDFDGATGTSTSPSVTSDSTTDGMAFTALAIGDGATLTKDASVTQITAIDNGNGTIGGGGGDMALFAGYETPAGATNTITHTLSASGNWRIGQITLRATAAGSAPNYFMRRLQ